MSAIRRFKRQNVDPFTGKKLRKGNNPQLIILSGSINNFCKLFITKTIKHRRY